MSHVIVLLKVTSVRKVQLLIDSGCNCNMNMPSKLSQEMSTTNGQVAERPLGVELNPSLINERSTECVNLLITDSP